MPVTQCLAFTGLALSLPLAFGFVVLASYWLPGLLYNERVTKETGIQGYMLLTENVSSIFNILCQVMRICILAEIFV